MKLTAKHGIVAALVLLNVLVAVLLVMKLVSEASQETAGGPSRTPRFDSFCRLKHDCTLFTPDLLQHEEYYYYLSQAEADTLNREIIDKTTGVAIYAFDLRTGTPRQRFEKGQALGVISALNAQMPVGVVEEVLSILDGVADRLVFLYGFDQKGQLQIANFFVMPSSLKLLPASFSAGPTDYEYHLYYPRSAAGRCFADEELCRT